MVERISLRSYDRAECQSARMLKITNDGLTRSGTGGFIAVYPYENSGRQRVNKSQVDLAMSRIYCVRLHRRLITAHCWKRVLWQSWINTASVGGCWAQSFRRADSYGDGWPRSLSHYRFNDRFTNWHTTILSADPCATTARKVSIRLSRKS